MWHSYKILGQKEKIKQMMNGELPVPSCATLHLSYLCNQNCKSCAYASYNSEKFIPSEERVMYYIKELMDFGITAFDISGGGDPTTIPYILNVLEYIISRNGNFSFVTNGWMMKKELMDYIGKYATYIRISLETGDKELYGKYKRISSSAFGTVINNIQYLGENRSPDTELSIKFDVDIELFGKIHIEQSIKILHKLPGITMAQFKSMAGETELIKEDKILFSDYVNKCIDKYKPKVPVINSIIRKYPVPKCTLSPLQTTVDGKGKVYLCCYYYDDNNRLIGDLNKNTFAEIWGSAKHKECVRNIKRKDCNKYDCKFFAHHSIINDSFVKGRLDIL
jgi:radical SAM protein with 4Fe4S-binding SPASM domain